MLFQWKGSIVASAVLLEMETFAEPDAEGYRGAFYFDVRSIKVFEPLDETAMQEIWPDVLSFNNRKQKLKPPEKHVEFERRLKRIRTPANWLRDDEADSASPDNGEGYYPEAIDRRPVVEQQIRIRRGQGQFREALRTRYGDRCLVTQCGVLAVLEAAHINPYRGEQDNHPENGLLLRSDIHTLFDLDLLGIEPQRFCVELHPDIAEEYQRFSGVVLPFPGDRHPSPEALNLRYLRFRQRLYSPA